MITLTDLIDTPDGLLAHLLAARCRILSARAAGLHATARELTNDALNEIEAWLAGAERMEQVAAEHERVDAQLARWKTEAETLTEDGMLIPF